MQDINETNPTDSTQTTRIRQTLHPETNSIELHFPSVPSIKLDRDSFGPDDLTLLRFALHGLSAHLRLESGRIPGGAERQAAMIQELNRIKANGLPAWEPVSPRHKDYWYIMARAALTNNTYEDSEAWWTTKSDAELRKLKRWDAMRAKVATLKADALKATVDDGEKLQDMLK